MVLSPDCDFASPARVRSHSKHGDARASALRLVGGLKPAMRYREDHELWVRMAACGYRFRALPRVLTSLRLHSANLEMKHHRTRPGGTANCWKCIAIAVHCCRGWRFCCPRWALAAVSPWCCTTPIGSRAWATR